MYIILNFAIKNFCQKWNFKSNLYFDFYGEKGRIQILKSEVKCHGFIWLIQNRMACISDPNLTAAKVSYKLFILNTSQADVNYINTACETSLSWNLIPNPTLVFCLAHQC